VKRAAIGGLAALLAAAPVAADPTTPNSLAGAAAGASAAPATTVTTRAAPAETPQRGLALGIELGEPTSATAGWFTGKLAVLGAVGTGTLAGMGLQLHADVQVEVLRLAPNLPLRVGGGVRVYHHGYTPASIDEVPDTHLGLRGSAALALERGPLQLYAELAPGVDVLRSSSCSLASGARSVCPHAQDLPVFVQFTVGARWFLSH